VTLFASLKIVTINYTGKYAVSHSDVCAQGIERRHEEDFAGKFACLLQFRIYSNAEM